MTISTLTFNKTAHIDVGAYVHSYIVSTPYVYGNTAMATASANAFGLNTFTDAETHTGTTSISSGSAASSISVTTP